MSSITLRTIKNADGSTSFKYYKDGVEKTKEQLRNEAVTLSTPESRKNKNSNITNVNTKNGNITRTTTSDKGQTIITDRNTSGQIIATRIISSTSRGKTLETNKYDYSGISSTPAGVNASPPPTSEKIGLYAELNADGSINNDIYTRGESGAFSKIQSEEYTEENGVPVRRVFTSQVTPELKKSIERGSVAPVTESVTGQQISDPRSSLIYSNVKSDPNIINPPKSNVEVLYSQSGLTWGGVKERAGNLGESLGVLGYSVFRRTFTPLVVYDAINNNDTFKLFGNEYPLRSPLKANVANDTTKKILELGANNPLETAGVGALIWTTGGAGLTALKGTTAYTTTATTVSKIYGANWATKLLIDGGVSLTKLGVITTTGNELFKLTNQKLQKNLDLLEDTNIDLRSARVEARKAEREAISSSGGFTPFGISFKGVLNDVNPLLYGNKEIYAETLTKELQQQGLTPSQVATGTNAGLQLRTEGAKADVLGMIAINAISEGVGRRYATEAFFNLGKKNIPATSWNIFKSAGFATARAGAIEGAGIAIVEDITRAETLTPKKLLSYSAFGAGSAGIIGGTIVGTQFAKSTTARGLGKVLEFNSNIIDPYEKIGDFTQTASERFLLKFFGKTSPKPIIYKTGANVFTFTPSNTNTKTKTNNNKPILSLSLTNTNTNTNVLSNVITPTETKTTTSTKIFNDVFTQANANVNTKIDIFDNTITTTTPINTPVNVPISTPVAVPVNVNIPFARAIPPILPLSFGSGTGGGRSGGKTRRKYLNEVSIAGGLFNDLIGSRKVGDFSKTIKSFKLNKPKTKKKSRRGRYK